MTTYTLTADLEVSTQTEDGPLAFTYKAGAATPSSDLEAGIFADLERAGVVSVVPAKTTKTPKASAEETE